MRYFFTLLILLASLAQAETDSPDTSSSATTDDSATPQEQGELPAVLENLGLSAEDEIALIRGNFMYSYLTHDYYLTLFYLDELNALRGDTEQDSESDVMRAAVLLALGLEQDADRIFNEVINSGGQASGDAWYFLAKRWMQLGEAEKAEQAARRSIESPTPVRQSFDAEVRMILVSSIAAQNRVGDAQAALRGLPDDDVWAGYAKYNLILAMIRTNYYSPELKSMVKEAVYYLPQTDEGAVLRDRTLLIAGIHAMEKEKYRLADRYLRDISLNTTFTAPGLLNYGWNLFLEGRYEDAVQPWRVLRGLFNHADPDVIESLVAVPFTLELFQATNQSVVAYRDVEQHLTNAIAHLRELNDPALISDWLANWERINRAEAWGWNRNTLSVFHDDPLTARLYPMLDDDVFLTEVELLHDLNRLADDLTDTTRSLDLWSDVVDQRREYLTNLDAETVLDAYEDRQEVLLKKVLDLQSRIMRERKDVFGYASADEKDNVDRLARVVENIIAVQKSEPSNPELGRYKERWRRMRGLLLWQVNEARPQRQWDADSDHMALRSETDRLFAQLEYTRNSLVWADNSWKGFMPRIEELRLDSVSLQAYSRSLHRMQKEYVIELAQEHMNELDKRLTLYLAQTRLALARLYDDALQQQISVSPEARP